jgi:hypothetical protein
MRTALSPRKRAFGGGASGGGGPGCSGLRSPMLLPACTAGWCGGHHRGFRRPVGSSTQRPPSDWKPRLVVPWAP